MGDIRELIQQAAAGEKRAWDGLVEQYCPLIWRLLGKFANLSRTEKEDLAQDVFVVLLARGFQAFRGSTVHEFRSYVKTITDNEAKSYLRQHGRRFEVLDPLLSDEEEGTSTAASHFPDPNPGPEEQVARREAWQHVRLCLQEIPTLDQEIFWM